MITVMMEWTIDRTYNLIELYKERRILWDPKDKSYYLQNRREDAWEELGEHLQVSVAEVKRKMNSLLASYRRERLKMKLGDRLDDTPKWFAYLKLGFLNDRHGHWNRQKSLKARGDDDDDDDEECGVIPEVSMGDSSEDNTDAYSQIVIVPKDLKSPTKKVSVGKRKNSLGRISRPTKTFRIVQPTTSRTRERDDCDVYAEYVATEIRKLDHRVQLNVKHLINNIIFEAQMGMHDDISTVNAQQTPQT